MKHFYYYIKTIIILKTERNSKRSYECGKHILTKCVPLSITPSRQMTF